MAKIVWSAHKLKYFQQCPRKYYYKYEKKPRLEEIIPPHFARGIFLHKWVTKFYKSDGTLKYKSAKAFANSIKGPWRRIVKQGKIQGQKIEKWEWENTPYIIEAQMIRILKTIYNFYEKQIPPLLKEQRLKTELELEGRIFYLTGQLDEVRVDNGFIIRDHKTKGKIPKDSVLNFDIQFTFYPLLLASAIKSGSLDSLVLKVPEILKEKLELALEKMQGKSLLEIAKSIKLEYHPLSRGKVIPVKTRTPKDFYDLFNDLAEAEDEIEQYKAIDVWPRKKFSCGECFFSDTCNEDFKEGRKKIKMQGELFGGFSKPIKIKEKEKTFRIRFPRKKKKKA